MKECLSKELRIYASVGDMVLNLVTQDILNANGRKLSKQVNFNMFNRLKSNNFIRKFDRHYRLKKPLVNPSRGVLGDLSEANIGFLYLNYGYDMATRYIVKSTAKVLREDKGIFNEQERLKLLEYYE